MTFRANFQLATALLALNSAMGGRWRITSGPTCLNVNATESMEVSCGIDPRALAEVDRKEVIDLIVPEKSPEHKSRSPS